VFVKDINTGSSGSYPEKMTAVGNTLFFTADDGVHGRILWKSDGTTDGTAYVKEVFLENDQEYPANLFNYDGRLMFWMGDDEHGLELWTTNEAGDEDSTYMIQDINPGIEGSLNSWVTNMVYIGDTLFFPAKDNTHGNELWCMIQDYTGLPKNNDEHNIVTVYPNPNNGYFSIISKGSEITGYEIFDMYGKTISDGVSNHTNTDIIPVSINNIATGIYMIRVVTTEGVFRYKIVKE